MCRTDCIPRSAAPSDLLRGHRVQIVCALCMDTWLSMMCCWEGPHWEPTRFELSLHLYLFYLVIIDTHHTTCNFVHDEIFGAECIFQIWNFQFKTCVASDCFSVEFYPVSPVQKSGVLPVRCVVIVWYIHVWFFFIPFVRKQW